MNGDFWKKESKSKLENAALYYLRLSFMMIQKLREDNCLQRAAALSFTTAFAMVPLIAVFFSVFQAFGGMDAYGSQMMDFIKQNFFASAQADNIVEFLQDKAKNASFVSIGIIGVTFLMLSAVFLFNSIEATFNMIWRVGKSRAFIMKFVSFWSILTLGPVLIGISIYLTSFVMKSQLYEQTFASTIFGGIVTSLLPFIQAWIIFFLAYRLFPNTRVRFKSALSGAIIAGSLWEFAKIFFGFYAFNMISVTKVYGAAFGLVPILLLWLYISWIIVLFGVEICYAVQNVNIHTQQKREALEGWQLREVVGLRIMMTLAENFAKGNEPLSAQNLSERIGIPKFRLEHFIDAFHEAGLIHIVEGRDHMYVPAKPLDSILVTDVINSSVDTGWLITKMESNDEYLFYKKFSDDLKDAFNKTISGKNIKELLLVMNTKIERNNGASA